jgi:GT2 family glycosyltransferase
LLATDFLQYISRKIDTRPVELNNMVSQESHHLRNQKTKPQTGKVSVVIPTRDKPELLEKCVKSVIELTKYPEIEILIVNNQSVEPATLALLESFKAKGVKVLNYPKAFNFSAMCNLAASQATGDYLCFLNNDTEVVDPNWLSKMVEHAIQPEVGVVGAILTYPNGNIQHMGVALNFGGIATHPYRGSPKASNVPDSCFQVSAVTFACALISSSKYALLGGLDEKFPSGFNDVDFGIRSAERNFTNIVCTKAHLIHAESLSRPRSSTLSGIVSGLRDVFQFLKKHKNLTPERFFSR